MALPPVKTLLDCTNFSQTVLPYVSQLYDLPHQILASHSSLEELKQIYIATNPLISGFALSLFLAPLFLVVSEINRNYSQVDRCWSILPSIYNAHFCLYGHLAGAPTRRLDNLLACSVVWSLRLTFNYWRKGGYSIGSEDYRWELLRKRMSPALFFVLNVTFISLIQSILLFLITTPAYVLLLVEKTGAPLFSTDNIFPRILMGLILVEFFADQQQWDFQNAKKFYLKTAKVPPKYDQEDLDRGFIVTGLWSWSRHPNFAAEQAVWIAIYQWTCFTTGTLLNWTGVGALGYIILFQGSTRFTEEITGSRYTEYKEYQQRVGKFLPRLSSELPGDFSDQKATPKVEKGNKVVNSPKKGGSKN